MSLVFMQPSKDERGKLVVVELSHKSNSKGSESSNYLAEILDEVSWLRVGKEDARYREIQRNRTCGSRASSVVGTW